MIKYLNYMICVILLVCLILGCSQDDVNTWDFQYVDDNFTDDAHVDLRYLNEEYAGEHGFITTSIDGNSFVRVDGKPIRFWTVNGGGVARKLSDEELAYYARFLAKMGVNMIRHHGSINAKGKNTRITDVDDKELDTIWRLVAAMKKEGIYTTISPFWAHNGHMGDWIPEEWGIDGYSGKDGLWGVMYFNDRLKEAYKIWVRKLYTQVNPYTGIPLRDEPAVALIQIKNEDGVFFWTMQNINPELKSLIVKKYSAWLIKKYGSLEAALKSWDNYGLPGDSPESGVLDIFQFYDLTLDKSGSEAKRVKDQVEFYLHTQYSFYKEINDYYKKQLGCKQLVNATNWKTGDPLRLNDLERYTYTSCDVVAVNRYYSPNHAGENNGWRIDPGHYYKSISCLHQPARFPINIKQVYGYPTMMTESGWNYPQKFMAEAPFLISAYSSLTGIDGYYWFCPSAKAYDQEPYFTWKTFDDGQHPMHRWTCSIPGAMGLFPANALSYRLNYVASGEKVLHEMRSMDALTSRKKPLISEGVGYDPNRDEGYTQKHVDTKITPLAYLSGPVYVTYGGIPESTYIDQNISKLANPENRLIESVTDQLTWDYIDGICTLNAPKSKGVCGFLGTKRNFDLGDVFIHSDNDYAVVNIVSMDEKPIASSGKILVQIGTQYQPTGWMEEQAKFEHNDTEFIGNRILNTGKMPWQCVNTKVWLRIKNVNIKRAILLNTSLYAVKDLPVTRSKDTIKLKLPQDAMYVVLTSK